MTVPRLYEGKPSAKLRPKKKSQNDFQDVYKRQIEESVEFLMEGHVPYAFRTTVVREFHQKSDFEQMGLWIRGADKYYLQQFENSGGLIQDGLHAYDPPVLEQALEIMKRYVNDAEIRGI